jgi:hypothetical protein
VSYFRTSIPCVLNCKVGEGLKGVMDDGVKCYRLRKGLKFAYIWRITGKWMFPKCEQNTGWET